MTRLPPSSTLFPYTTLFRSHRRLCHSELYLCGGRGGKGSGKPGGNVQHDQEVCLRELLYEGKKRGPVESILSPAQDRKSTRLNSSHVRISYAVFCLKKKILS